MSRLVNAQRVLGVNNVVTHNDILKAFQNRVLELSRNNLSPQDFSDNLDYLLKSRDYLLRMYPYMNNTVTEPHDTRNNLHSNYKSYSSVIEMRNGDVVHASDKKMSAVNGKVVKEERYYDGKNGTINVKKIDPDGKVYTQSRPVQEYYNGYVPRLT